LRSLGVCETLASRVPPWATRAYTGIDDIPIAMTAFNRPSPRIVVTASARRIPGMPIVDPLLA
jgi:hypothetical protein